MKNEIVPKIKIAIIILQKAVFLQTICETTIKGIRTIWQKKTVKFVHFVAGQIKK